MPDIVVVIGTGGIGLAVARRLGTGRRLVLADYSTGQLDAAEAALTGEGHNVTPHAVDVTDRASVEKLVAASAALGRVDAVVHTAGVSPEQATSGQIYRVNLLGTAHVVDEFVHAAGPGTTLTCIASMAAYRQAVPPAVEWALATTATDDLLDLDLLDVDAADPRTAYHLAKRGAQLRVVRAAAAWGARGARVNTVSPGLISTPMGALALAGAQRDNLRRLVEQSPAGRAGTPDDIAAAVAFLAGAEASFVTGADLLVDGGATAVRRWGL